MKANELRIGNFILYDCEPEPIKRVSGIRIEVDKDGKEYERIFFIDKTMADCRGKTSNWITPIPLTEEWLQKFGFELRDSVNGGYLKTTNRLLKEYIYCSKKGIVALYSELTEETKKDYIIGEIQSVHQLQNLYFALTGNELQIK